MILPSLNASNCGDLLLNSDTIPSGNEMAIRKNSEVGTIRSQGSLKKDQGSTTTKSILGRYIGMEKFARMGQVLCLTIIALFISFSTVKAHVVFFGHNKQIFNSVVGSNSVNMVNNFIGSQVATKMLFANESMFHDTSSCICIGVFGSVQHDIATITSGVSRMKRVIKFEPILSGNSGDISCTHTENSSCFFGSQSCKGHFLENVNRNSFSFISGYSISFHIAKNKFFRYSMFLSDLGSGLQFSVIPVKLFGSNEKFFGNATNTGDIILFHPNKYRETLHSVSLSKLIKRFGFVVIPSELFFADKKFPFTWHNHTISPKGLNVKEKYQEIV